MQSATGTWLLMIAYLFFTSSKAAGMMLKFAAIGVHSVPQYPAVSPRAPTTTGLAPCMIRNGMPIPTVMTENAAKPLPMIMVNSAIATQYTRQAMSLFPSGTIAAQYQHQLR